MSEIEKKFVTSELTVSLTCPKCGKTRQADVSHLMAHQTKVQLKCKCTCGNEFSVQLERRRSIRKELALPGKINYHGKSYKIRINNLSRHGLNFELLEKLTLKPGERIAIQFEADDPLHSPIQREVRVKNLISPENIGCEFLSFDHYGSLGKYFLFHF